MEKAMAPRSSTLAWNIPWVEEPGRLQSMGCYIILQAIPLSSNSLPSPASNPCLINGGVNSLTADFGLDHMACFG